jgi:hypothetical protein
MLVQGNKRLVVNWETLPQQILVVGRQKQIKESGIQKLKKLIKAGQKS